MLNKKKFFNKKIIYLLKKFDYEIKLKKHFENELENNQKILKNQLDEMWMLINQAQEKLKHENRKKFKKIDVSSNSTFSTLN